jgi:hypothetical protein
MQTDFLKYDASSIQELLRRKLLESGLYTDQVYPGSDTRILIDLFAWTFDVLTYILNNNAADTLFEDTEVYENLNKIVKLLTYNPKAFTTSNAEFSISCTLDEFTNNEIFCTIPKYCSIDTGKSDANGNSIKYSFIEDFTFKMNGGSIVGLKNGPILYNGEFVRYIFDNTAENIPYETFIMTNVSPNADIPVYIDNDTIHIYIEKVNEKSGEIEYTEVQIVNNLVLDSAATDLSCEVRVNENKELVVKFGDDIHGKKLELGTKVHVVYLQSNAGSGKIDANEVSVSKISLGIKNINSQTELINMCYSGIDTFILNYYNLFVKNQMPLTSISNISLTNLHESSDVKDYEDITEIKEHAPSMFRLGNRLITSNDFKTYILNNFSNRIEDVYVCNNNEYCTNFYMWLNKFNSFNSNIRLMNYEFANACDFNNVYLWLKPIKNRTLLDSDKKIIVKKCDQRKSLTANLVPCNAIETYFMPYMKPSNDKAYEINNHTIDSHFTPPVKILVKKGKTYLSDEKIKNNIVTIITNYFDEKNELGATINLSELYQKIMSLGYIDSVKTIYYDTDEVKMEDVSYCEGLSFAKFTTPIINNGDFEHFTQYYTLEKFQYPTLLNSSKLFNLIYITSENIFSIKNNEF